MKKPVLSFIIALLMVSLAGALIMQGLWLNNAWQNKRETFDRDVTDALNKVAERLETREAATFLSSRFEFGGTPEVYLEARSQKDTNWHFNGAHAPSGIQYRNLDPYDLFDTLKKQTEVFMVSASRNGDEIILDSQQSMVAQFGVTEINDGGTVHKRVITKSQQLSKVLNQMVLEWSTYDVPTAQRLDIATLHELIKQELGKKGIDVPFQFGVVSGSDKKDCCVQSSQFSSEMIPASFSASLFPSDLTYRTDQLLVFFDDVRPYFLRSLWTMIILSVLFSLIITGTFGGVVYVILRQKKLSEIKTDFINNMTHEFKTPLATISVAVDAINNPRILQDQGKIRYYTGIIGNENRRMHSQVEHILQMALLDKENFDLNETLMDVHPIVEQVAECFRLQMESREGTLKLDLQAANSFILGDQIHLTNVIHNLLDNAVKYSPDQPEIMVFTRNNDNGLVLTVQDRGAGMKADVQRRIFEKFYREPNGNVHNVKGFGLGLAYVKTIIDKHRGTITLHSEPGLGSSFEIFLPFGHHS